MGLPTYMNYYTVHDDEDNRVGFVPHNYSNKKALKEGE
jgi:hypothetical protein